MNTPITELVYAGGAAEACIRNRFPTAVIEDASDSVREERFVEVTLSAEVTEKEFYVFMLKEGLAGACLGFRLLMLGDDSEKDRVADWVDEATGKKVSRPWAERKG